MPKNPRKPTAPPGGSSKPEGRSSKPENEGNSSERPEEWKGVLYHPNSVFARADKALRARARRARVRYYADRRSVETWAEAGFQATGGDDRERDGGES